MSKTINLPLTTPGGMDAHVHIAAVPEVDDRVVLGPISMPMTEFCALVRHVLTDGPLHAADQRVALVGDIQAGAFGAASRAPVGRGGALIERRPFSLGSPR